MGRFIIHFIAFVLVVTVNGLANALPLNGQTTGEISNRLDVLFTPAGYVFSIWGLIYILLGIWIIRQFPVRRRNLPLYRNTSGLFVLSSILNSLWILLWHYEFFVFSVVVMILLLASLVRLYVNAKSVDASFFDLLPFSVYLGWVSVATIANISYYLNHIEWDGFGLSASIWTFFLLLVATVLALYFLKKEDDGIYPLVFVWAFIGIGVKNQGGGVPLVIYSSYIFATILLIVTLVSAVRRRNK